MNQLESDIYGSDEKPTARLENWTRVGNMFYGNVYEHPRFIPGYQIHTSYVVSVEGDRLETRNTIYTLGKPL
jgi:hypothetical protein